MDPISMVESVADAAFACDQAGRLVAWNPAAERLLGYRADDVLGKPCHAILRGRDASGNCYCGTYCNPRAMASHSEAIHSFEVSVAMASGEPVEVLASILVARGPPGPGLTLIHLLHPWPATRPARKAAPRGYGLSQAGARRRPLELTKRELEILRLLAAGAQTDAIAQDLCVSVSTIRTHIQHVLEKLESHNRLQAVSRARLHGLI